MTLCKTEIKHNVIFFILVDIYSIENSTKTIYSVFYLINVMDFCKYEYSGQENVVKVFKVKVLSAVESKNHNKLKIILTYI